MDCNVSKMCYLTCILHMHNFYRDLIVWIAYVKNFHGFCFQGPLACIFCSTFYDEGKFEDKNFATVQKRKKGQNLIILESKNLYTYIQ